LQAFWKSHSAGLVRVEFAGEEPDFDPDTPDFSGEDAVS
jgi:hypothetical protein